MSKELITAIAEMKDTEAIKLTEELINKGTDAGAILHDCQQAMEIVGKRFENKEYFLPELIMSGEILKQITAIVKPKMKETTGETKKLGKVLFGTVAGDIHDIGKDIVVFMLDVNGFEVHDIGVDVPSDKFVEKIKVIEPDIVGLSGFLTIAFDAMKETVKAIEAAGCRNKVKIMIGGGTVTEEIKDYTGADAFGESAMDAVTLAKKWMGGE